MLAMAKQESTLVWGDDSILDALEAELGWRPSRSWLRRWSDPDRENRIPVKKLEGAKQRCLDVIDLREWMRNNVK